jgi:signal transduction histidine kinase
VVRPFPPNRRILIIDDDDSVHEDLRKLLGQRRVGTGALEEKPLGEATDAPAPAGFDVDSAHQGEEGLAMVQRAQRAGRPYAMAFVDVRLPPGGDVIDTVARLWRDDPDVQVVLGSACSDDSWKQTVAALGEGDRFVILRKPFDDVEVRQLASAMTAKWTLARQARARLEDLDTEVVERTCELQRTNERLRQEIARRERVDSNLRQAHKLEAVGRLAAGIAHEINSPMQFVAASLQFIGQSLPTVMALVDRARATGDASVADADALAYLAEELPGAVKDAETGVARVADIVRSMKSLSHPGQAALAPVDVNQTLEAALTICHSEIRHVADVYVDLAQLPTILASAADLGQTFVNLIVNAVDAMREAIAGTDRRGRLSVRTSVDGDHVVAAIGDDGGGIPESIRDKIFEPFFTTKCVGRGTGQGLAIARSIVTDRLGGTLAFDTHVGAGTTFTVRLPLARTNEVAA